MLSQSEENYLKAIYSLSELQGEAISTNLLSDKMSTKPSSVTDMVKKLSDKKLISYKKYSLVNQNLIFLLVFRLFYVEIQLVPFLSNRLNSILFSGVMDIY